MLKEWKWTMRAECWRKSLELECNSNEFECNSDEIGWESSLIAQEFYNICTNTDCDIIQWNLAIKRSDTTKSSHNLTRQPRWTQALNKFLCFSPWHNAKPWHTRHLHGPKDLTTTKLHCTSQKSSLHFRKCKASLPLFFADKYSTSLLVLIHAFKPLESGVLPWNLQI